MLNVPDFLREFIKTASEDGKETLPLLMVESLATKIEEQAVSRRITLDLDNGATLEILLHPWDEQTWIFTYRFEAREAHDTRLLCDWKCILRYCQGRLIPSVGVTMHVIIPELLGQQHYLGVDISPGAKTFLQMEYEHDREGAPLLLQSITKGVNTKVEIPQGSREGLPMISVELPWPLVITDRIERQSHTDPDGTVHVYGDYQVPFPWRGDKQEDGVWLDEIRFVTFPHKLEKV